MVCTISRINTLLHKHSTKHLVKFDLRALAGGCSKSMFPWQGPNPEAYFSGIANSMNVRRVRSEETVYSSSVSEGPWAPHMIYKEWYSSAEAQHHSSHSPQTIVQNNQSFMPQPPPPGTEPVQFESFLMPRSVSLVQQRYYVTENGGSNGAVPYCNPQETSKILKVLSKRYWQDVNGPKKISRRNGFEFVLMSYNVLAQKLIDEHLYLYKKHNYASLKWEIRWANLFNEIATMQPDVMCLQEVQETHLRHYYSKLEVLGYRMLYKRRTGLRSDGCAIYYKIDKLCLVEYDTVEFYQPEVAVLDRDNIAIIAKFAPRDYPEKHFIVATTHLLYNPKRQDVRLAQTQLLLTEVERLSYHKNHKGKPKYWPIIITGDFNSTPDSAIYQLITKGSFKYDHLAERRLNRPESPRQGRVLVPADLEVTDTCQHARLVEKRLKNEEISRRDEVALIKLHHRDKTIAKITTETIQNPAMFSSGTLNHLFALKSVYEHGTPEDPEGTTFQDEWITVDYIFYSGKKRDEEVEDHKLKLLSVYRLPLRNELGHLTIPNSLMGSDHLSLVAKFKLNV